MSEQMADRAETAREAVDSLASHCEDLEAQCEDLEATLADLRSEFNGVEHMATVMAEAIGWDTEGDSWVEKAVNWKQNPDDIPGLYVELTALRRVVRRLALTDPGGLTDDDYCIFCGEYLRSHEPDCVWVQAKEVVRGD